jgi:hypothetical protein
MTLTVYAPSASMVGCSPGILCSKNVEYAAACAETGEKRASCMVDRSEQLQIWGSSRSAMSPLVAPEHLDWSCAASLLVSMELSCLERQARIGQPSLSRVESGQRTSRVSPLADGHIATLNNADCIGRVLQTFLLRKKRCAVQLNQKVSLDPVWLSGTMI